MTDITPMDRSLATFLRKVSTALFYKIQEIIDLVNTQSLIGKADKVTGATADNFASLDAVGNLEDSGLPKSKLAGVEDGATADQTGAEIKTAYEGESDTNAFTDAEKSKLSGIEASADVTDATNVNAAGAVMESDFNAQTVLAAVSDNTPTPITIGEAEILGRATGGNVGALTAANVRTIINVENGADVTDATNVNTAGAVMNSDTTTASMSFVIDEDDMSSDSATKVPTQQSVKAYTDTFAKVKTGSYTGDGTTSNGITGVGFQPKIVWIWTHPSSETAQTEVFKCDQSWGDYAFYHINSNLVSLDNRIKSLDSDGFTVSDDEPAYGSEQHPNKNGTTYDYLAIG